MQIALWSNMHGQAATSATTAALASMIAQKTAYKTLVAHNHYERSALEGYFFKQTGQFEQNLPGLNNQGMDALIRLIRNGRLKPEMITDYTYSLLKNHRLDILLGTYKKEQPGEEDKALLLNIFECARRFYDVVLLDVHSGLTEALSRSILEGSDIIVFCLNQNRFLLDDFQRLTDNNSFIKEKRCAYVLSRYEKQASATKGNLARSYRMNPKSLFVLPNNVRFADALNQGRVFDFVAYYQNAREGEERDFLTSLGQLCDFVLEGCAD